jgi:hypothetical protein
MSITKFAEAVGDTGILDDHKTVKKDTTAGVQGSAARPETRPEMDPKIMVDDATRKRQQDIVDKIQREFKSKDDSDQSLLDRERQKSLKTITIEKEEPDTKEPACLKGIRKTVGLMSSSQCSTAKKEVIHLDMCERILEYQDPKQREAKMNGMKIGSAQNLLPFCKLFKPHIKEGDSDCNWNRVVDLVHSKCEISGADNKTGKHICMNPKSEGKRCMKAPTDAPDTCKGKVAVYKSENECDAACLSDDMKYENICLEPTEENVKTDAEKPKEEYLYKDIRGNYNTYLITAKPQNISDQGKLRDMTGPSCVCPRTLPSVTSKHHLT